MKAGIADIKVIKKRKFEIIIEKRKIEKERETYDICCNCKVTSTAN